MEKAKKLRNEAVVLFAGDSGDGMQLTGTQFTTTHALFGNDVATFPDFPAEIRAPQGTVNGVSGFKSQCHRQRLGSVLKRSTRSGCNPDDIVFVGSNPTAPTIV